MAIAHAQALLKRDEAIPLHELYACIDRVAPELSQLSSQGNEEALVEANMVMTKLLFLKYLRLEQPTPEVLKRIHTLRAMINEVEERALKRMRTEKCSEPEIDAAEKSSSHTGALEISPEAEARNIPSTSRLEPCEEGFSEESLEE